MRCTVHSPSQLAQYCYSGNLCLTLCVGRPAKKVLNAKSRDAPSRRAETAIPAAVKLIHEEVKPVEVVKPAEGAVSDVGEGEDEPGTDVAAEEAATFALITTISAQIDVLSESFIGAYCTSSRTHRCAKTTGIEECRALLYRRYRPHELCGCDESGWHGPDTPRQPGRHR